MPIELDREEQRAWLLLLHAPQLGAVAIRELVGRHGSAAAALHSNEARLPDFKGLKFTIQVAPEDCTGCGICFYCCPEPGAITVYRLALEKPVKPEVKNETAL